MRHLGIRPAALVLMLSLVLAAGTPARAEGDPHKVKHIIVIMHENHSFDNYFGALAYAPGSKYHTPGREDRDERDGGCRKGDHACVDGLTCRVDDSGNFKCGIVGTSRVITSSTWNRANGLTEYSRITW